jgi:hypothetical protein
MCHPHNSAAGPRHHHLSSLQPPCQLPCVPRHTACLSHTHVRSTQASAPPLGSPFLPGFMPSGTPAMPKISRSMDSLPGLAAGTLRVHAWQTQLCLPDMPMQSSAWAGVCVRACVCVCVCVRGPTSIQELPRSEWDACRPCPIATQLLGEHKAQPHCARSRCTHALTLTLWTWYACVARPCMHARGWPCGAMLGVPRGPMPPADAVPGPCSACGGILGTCSQQ